MTEGIPENMLRAEAIVRKNEPLGAHGLVLTLEVPEIAEIIEPAQFLMLRGFEAGFPFLPRPFSVFDVPPASGGGTPEVLEILYEIVGEGTAAMAGWRPGQRVACLGPLGHPFRVEETCSHPVMLAGGIGVAPFPFLSRRLPQPPSDQILLFGARSRDFLFALSRFEELGVRVQVATDDGSAGRRGTCLDLLEELARELPPETTQVFACGPTPMFKAAQPLVRRLGISCQMSLEERMACGYGACVGCVQAIEDPQVEEGWRYALICTEGPVFDSNRILYTEPIPGEAR